MSTLFGATLGNKFYIGNMKEFSVGYCRTKKKNDTSNGGVYVVWTRMNTTLGFCSVTFDRTMLQDTSLKELMETEPSKEYYVFIR